MVRYETLDGTGAANRSGDQSSFRDLFPGPPLLHRWIEVSWSGSNVFNATNAALSAGSNRDYMRRFNVAALPPLDIFFVAPCREPSLYKVVLNSESLLERSLRAQMVPPRHVPRSVSSCANASATLQKEGCCFPRQYF